MLDAGDDRSCSTAPLICWARDPAPSSLLWIPPVQLWARGDAAGVGVEIGFRSDEPEG